MHPPDVQTLLFNNLMLLDFPFYDKATFNRNNKENQKLFFQILHHVILKLTNDEASINFKTCFPTRTQNDIIEFKNVCYQYLKTLEKENKIPKNFVIGKSILEIYHGEKLVQFLRFLTEFTLRFVLTLQFPNEKIEIFNLLNKIPDNHTEKLNYDINELYSFISINDQNLIEANLDTSNINNSLKAVEIHLEREKRRLNRISNEFKENIKNYRNIAEKLNEENDRLMKEKTLRKKDIAGLEKSIPKNILSEFRAMDRIPQIDLSRELFKQIHMIGEKIEKNCLIDKTENIFCDGNEERYLKKEDFGYSRTLKKNVHLDVLYSTWNNSLSKLLNDLPQIHEFNTKIL